MVKKVRAEEPTEVENHRVTSEQAGSPAAAGLLARGTTNYFAEEEAY